MNHITIRGPMCIREAASLFLDIIEKDYSMHYRDEIQARGFKRTFAIVRTDSLCESVTCKSEGPIRYIHLPKRSYRFYWV